MSEVKRNNFEFASDILTYTITGVLVIFTMAASFVKVLQVLKTLKLNYTTVKVYKEMAVERNILIGFEKFTTCIGLTGLYIFLVFSLNGGTFAFKLGNSELFIIMITMSVLCFLIITFVFVFCCSINENSATILQQWKIQVVSRRNRFRMRKIIRSCRPLSVPAGNVGILDKEIKINYYHSVVVNTINLMVVMNDLLKVNKVL